MSKKSNRLLPSPRARDWKGKQRDLINGENVDKNGIKWGKDLNQMIQLLPTPQQRDYKNSNVTNEVTPRMQRKLEQGWTTDLNDMIASCSPQASPANHSAMPDENVERQMTVISGRRLSQSLKLSNPIGLFLRTCLESSIWYSPIVKLEWQAKALYSVLRMTKSAITTQSAEESNQTSDKQGMKQYGLLFQLAASAHPTEGIECGLLHSPSGQEPGVTNERLQTKDGQPAKIGERAYDKKTGRLAQVGLTQQINMGLLPTPCGMETDNRERVADAVARGKPTLKSRGKGEDNIQDNITNRLNFIAMLPTPMAQDAKDKGSCPSQTGKNEIAIVIEQSLDGQRTGMKLQPSFVEWMMGYPESWTELTD